MSLVLPETITSTRIYLECAGMILLVQRALDGEFPGLYELPGGKQEDPLASLDGTIVRELREETGLDVTLSDATPYPLDTYTIRDGKHTGKPYRAFGFVANVSSGVSVQISSEHRNFLWADPYQIERGHGVPTTPLTPIAVSKLMPVFNRNFK